MIDVTVIIVSFNTREITLSSIESVYKYTKEVVFEIIVVDNASDDNSVAYIKQRFPAVNVITNHTNIGFGPANNQALKIAKGEFVFLLNSDAFLTRNSILVFTKYLRESKNLNIAVCGGELVTGTERKTVSFGNFPTLKEAFFYIGFFMLIKKYFYRHLASGVVNYDESIKEVDYITGADMFIRKSAIDLVGHFDEDFFLYYEETELAFRLRDKGYSLVIIPEQKIIHLDGGSQKVASGFNYNKYKIFVTSRTLFFKKCYGGLSATFSKILFIVQLIVFTVLRKEGGNLFRKAMIIFRS